MKTFLKQYPFLLCGWGQIQRQRKWRGWILLLAFIDCAGISFYFLFWVKHPLGAPIGLLCLLLAFLLWMYSYLDYLEIAPRSFPSQDESAADLYEAGRVAYLRGELENAKKCFQKALKQNRYDWDALYQLGRVQMELGETRKARKLFERYHATNETKKWRREVEEYLTQIKGTAS